MKLSAIILSVLSIFPIVGFALNVDSNYTLDVKLKNVPDSVQFTLLSDDNAYRQKAYTNNGVLHFEFDIAEDYPVQLMLTGRNPENRDDRFIIGFFGGKCVKHTLVSHSNGFHVDSVSFKGAPWDAAQMEYERITNEYNSEAVVLSKKLSQLRMKQSPTPDEKAQSDSLIRLLIKKQKVHESQCIDWAKKNPTSPQVIDWLGWGYEFLSKDELRQIYSEVPEKLKQSPYGKKLGKIIEISPIKEGDNLSDYAIVAEDFAGKAVDLSEISTPYLLVEFGSLGCGVCRSAAKHELPGLVKKYEDIMTFVTYSVDDDLKRVKRMHEIDNATWPTVWSSDADKRDDIVLRYGVTGYPTFFLFGPDRKLIHTSSGWGPGSIQARLNQFPDFRDK